MERCICAASVVKSPRILLMAKNTHPNPILNQFRSETQLKEITYQRPESNGFYLSILFKKRFQHLNRRYYKHSICFCILVITITVEYLLVRLVLHYFHFTYTRPVKATKNTQVICNCFGVSCGSSLFYRLPKLNSYPLLY